MRESDSDSDRIRKSSYQDDGQLGEEAAELLRGLGERLVVALEITEEEPFKGELRRFEHLSGFTAVIKCEIMAGAALAGTEYGEELEREFGSRRSGSEEGEDE